MTRHDDVYNGLPCDSEPQCEVVQLHDYGINNPPPVSWWRRLFRRRKPTLSDRLIAAHMLRAEKGL